MHIAPAAAWASSPAPAIAAVSWSRPAPARGRRPAGDEPAALQPAKPPSWLRSALMLRRPWRRARPAHKWLLLIRRLLGKLMRRHRLLQLLPVDLPAARCARRRWRPRRRKPLVAPACIYV